MHVILSRSGKPCLLLFAQSEPSPLKFTSRWVRSLCQIWTTSLRTLLQNFQDWHIWSPSLLKISHIRSMTPVFLVFCWYYFSSVFVTWIDLPLLHLNLLQPLQSLITEQILRVDLLRNWFNHFLLLLPVLSLGSVGDGPEIFGFPLIISVRISSETAMNNGVLWRVPWALTLGSFSFKCSF